MNTHEAQTQRMLKLFRENSSAHEVHEDAQPEFVSEQQTYDRVVLEEGRAVGSIAGQKTHKLRWALVQYYKRGDDGVIRADSEPYMSVWPVCGTTRATGRGGHYQNYYGVTPDATPTCSKCAAK